MRKRHRCLCFYARRLSVAIATAGIAEHRGITDASVLVHCGVDEVTSYNSRPMSIHLCNAFEHDQSSEASCGCDVTETPVDAALPRLSGGSESGKRRQLIVHDGGGRLVVRCFSAICRNNSDL